MGLFSPRSSMTNYEQGYRSAALIVALLWLGSQFLHFFETLCLNDQTKKQGKNALLFHLLALSRLLN